MEWFVFHLLFNAGHCRNPQTEAFLELLELQYCLDNNSESWELPQRSGLFFSRGK